MSRRDLNPKNRTWEDATEMLLALVPLRGVLLQCVACRGTHLVHHPHLVFRCVCGATTIYSRLAVYYLWCGMTSRLSMRYGTNPRDEARIYYAHHGPRAEPNTRTSITVRDGAVCIDDLPVSIPTDLGVALWRLRQA